MLTLTTSTRPRRTYDHRVRALVQQTGDSDLLPELSIPRSTARSWVRRGPRQVVSLDVMDMDTLELQCEILRLRGGLSVMAAIVRLLLAVRRVSGFRLDQARLPEGQG